MFFKAAATLGTCASPASAGSRKNMSVTMNIKKTLSAETRKTFSVPRPSRFRTSQATAGPIAPPMFTRV